jgi:hypothetical protein
MLYWGIDASIQRVVEKKEAGIGTAHKQYFMSRWSGII